MGVVKSVASLLIEHFKQYPVSGSLLQLGRQEIFFTLSDLNQLLKRHEYSPANASQLNAITDHYRALTDKEFFGIFGFDAIHSLDYGTTVGDDIDHDLNSRDLPNRCRGAYQAIFDGGTMEHVFHVPNTLSNVGEMLAPGGQAIHVSPASNCVEHGFYSFSPCLLYEYYRANAFEVLSCLLLDAGTRLRPIRITAYSYLPPIPRALLDGYLPGNVHWVFCVALKTGDSTVDRVPQQSFYQDLWRHEASGGAIAAGAGWMGRLKSWVKTHPHLDRLVRRCALPWIRALTIARTRLTLWKLARRV